MSRDGQHRNAATMAIIKPVDQVQVPRTATADANRQLACEMGFGASRESGCLFVPNMNPTNLFSTVNRICDAVERISGHT